VNALPSVEGELAGSLAASAGGVAAAARRSVRVADVDQLRKQLEQTIARLEQVEERVDRCTEELSTSRAAFNGLHALQVVARQELFPLGSALQRCIASRLLERLKSCPSREWGGPTRANIRGKATLSIEVDAERRAVDELVEKLGLEYALPHCKASARVMMRTVRFGSPAALLWALGLPRAARAKCMRRDFTRKDGSKPTRVLLERHVDEDGSIWYILGRHAGTGAVNVATRQAESFNVSSQEYEHELKRRTVTRGTLDGVPEFCPAMFQWRGAPVGNMVDWDGAQTSGRVLVSVPCCVFEDISTDIEELLEEVGGEVGGERGTEAAL